MAQKHLQLLRNGSAYANYQAAYQELSGRTSYADGTPILARYSSGATGEIKTFDINLKKNILDNNNIKEIDFNDVATFGQYIILSIEITDKE